MVNLILSTLFFFTIIINSAYSYEGIIKLVQTSHYDTSYFTYLIKNENIRIDKYDSDQNLIQSLLIDLDDDEVFILSPSKKLYKKLELSDKTTTDTENFIIQKTQNSRVINNYECYQWRIKNIERNTEVTYWVWQNNFTFFEELVSLLSFTDKTYEFFAKIPDKQGAIPILSVERTLLRREKSRISIVEIKNGSIGDSTFVIPSDYVIINS